MLFPECPMCGAPVMRRTSIVKLLFDAAGMPGEAYLRRVFLEAGDLPAWRCSDCCAWIAEPAR